MMRMSYEELYKDLWEAVKGLCDARYLHSRPKSVPAERRPDTYVVVRLPATIYNEEMDSDGRYNNYTTTVEIDIFVRDRMLVTKPNGFNPSMMSKKVDTMMKRFPIKGKHCVVTRPRAVMQTDDGDGFAVTMIQGDLRTI